MTPDGGWTAHLGVTALLALLPFIAIAGTSFAKIAVVLGILRSALGAPGVPPSTVIAALAVVMSMFVMAPVATDIVDGIEAAGLDASKDDGLGMERARALYSAASPPLLDFLERNTPRGEIDHFAGLAGEPADPPSLRLLLPAFAVSELAEAFVMGFLILLPFLVIDLIVGNALLSMGLHMTPPAAVSLPLKLLLFIAVDGWHLLVDGLMVSYGM
jgi:type III secretion protein R